MWIRRKTSCVMTGGTLSRMSSCIASAIGKSCLDNFSRWSQGTDHLFCLPKIHLQISTKFASFLHQHRIRRNNTGNKIFRINANYDCFAAKIKVSSHMVIPVVLIIIKYKFITWSNEFLNLLSISSIILPILHKWPSATESSIFIYKEGREGGYFTSRFSENRTT